MEKERYCNLNGDPKGYFLFYFMLYTKPRRGIILGPVVQSPIKLIWVNMNFDSSLITNQ